MSKSKKNELAEIPAFTAEQYENTPEPYKWLYQFSDDKFMLQQAVNKLKKQAGDMGVKCFVSMWKAYRESQAKTNGQKLESGTEFPGQPIELSSGQYICNEDGVSVLDRFGSPQVICPHPIMPVRRLVNADTGEERLEISYMKGHYWRSIIVEKSVIASSQQILQLAAYGIIVNSLNAKELSNYLLTMENLNYDTIKEQKSVGRLGWIKEHGFSPYVDGVVFDGEMTYRDIFNAIQPLGSREKWIDAIRAVRAEKTVARLFLAASFASVILEPCGLLPFFVHAWGGQGNGKTVAVMIAASVWASPKMGDYVKTFDATEVGQEMTAAFLNSLPLCLDELQIQASAGQKDFDKMIYKLTEGVGRIRGAKNGGIRQIAKWKNCMLTTGEQPIINPNSAGGATVRVIEFECAEKVYSDLIGVLSVINENYGLVGREFVEWLQDDGNFEEIKSLQKEYYRQLLEAGGEDKQTASASALLAADKVATELFFQDGNELTVDYVSKFIKKKDDVNASARALEYIYELVGRNPMHFYANEFGDYRSEVWGKVENGYIYIIKSVFDREMTLAGFNGASFLAWASRNGILNCDGERYRKTRKVRIGNATVNTVCILEDSQVEQENGENGIEDCDELPL